MSAVSTFLENGFSPVNASAGLAGAAGLAMIARPPAASSGAGAAGLSGLDGCSAGGGPSPADAMLELPAFESAAVIAEPLVLAGLFVAAPLASTRSISARTSSGRSSMTEYVTSKAAAALAFWRASAMRPKFRSFRASCTRAAA
jgi:hypothetical protein